MENSETKSEQQGKNENSSLKIRVLIEGLRFGEFAEGGFLGAKLGDVF